MQQKPPKVSKVLRNALIVQVEFSGESGPGTCPVWRQIRTWAKTTRRCITLPMRITSSIVVIVLGFILSVSASPKPQVTFCELVSNPELYNGKVVTVRATYKYGFEWQMLYCLDCLDKGKA
jgi:hypothetical protein